MTDIVMSRPRSDVTVKVKSYIGDDGKYVNYDNGSEPEITFTSLSSVMWRVEVGVDIYNVLDFAGANYGYVISPNRYTGRMRVLITDENTPKRLRELVDTWAMCDVKIDPSTEDGHVILRDAIFTSEDVDIGSAMRNVPILDFNLTALMISVYDGTGTLIDTYGDGWENVGGNPEDNSAW